MSKHNIIDKWAARELIERDTHAAEIQMAEMSLDISNLEKRVYTLQNELTDSRAEQGCLRGYIERVHDTDKGAIAGVEMIPKRRLGDI